MTTIIKKLKTTYLMYLKSCNIALCDKQMRELNDIFEKINNEFINKTLWCAPELINDKALDIIYKYIHKIIDREIYDSFKIYWNRFLTRSYFRKKYESSNIKDIQAFYINLSEKQLKSKYEKCEKYDYIIKFLKLNLNKVANQSPPIKPFIVRLIEDNDYGFITQRNFKIYLIRSNNKITTHFDTKCFNNNYIYFNDNSCNYICNKGLIWALV